MAAPTAYEKRLRESIYTVLKLSLEDAAERNSKYTKLEWIMTCLFYKNRLNRDKKIKCGKKFETYYEGTYDLLVDNLKFLRKEMGTDILLGLKLGSTVEKILKIYDRVPEDETRLEVLKKQLENTKDSIKTAKKHIRRLGADGIRVNLGAGTLFQSVPLFSFNIQFGKKKLKAAEFVLDVEYVVKRIYEELIKEEKDKKKLVLYAMRQKGLYPDLLGHFAEYVESGRSPEIPANARNNFIRLPSFVFDI